MPPSYSFTVAFPVLRDALLSPCNIFSGLTGQQSVRANALWDTGATNCVISQKVVDELGLKPHGTTQVVGVHGVKIVDVYIVDIGLPNGVLVPGLAVTLGDFGGDILVGMDIIGAGDFAVTNRNGKTKFTFRMPSEEDIDFVGEPRRIRRLNRGAWLGLLTAWGVAIFWIVSRLLE